MKLGDPRDYKIEISSLNNETVDSLIDRYFSEFLRPIGKMLGDDFFPLMKELGQYSTTGNYSVRVPEGGFLITGSGVNKVDLSKDSLVYIQNIDYEKGTYFMAGKARPSRETLIHDQIYKSFPQVNVVIHTHDADALKYGCSKTTSIPIFFANVKEACEVVNALRCSSYVTLPTHGQFVIAQNVGEALDLIEHRHRVAVEHKPINRLYSGALGGMMLASFSLLLAASITQYIRFKDCEYQQNTNGTVTYTCEQSKVKNCGVLHTWEGESQCVVQGNLQCTFLAVTRN